MEINEDKLKEILNEQRSEYQHFMGIMKEELQSNIQVIGEQYQGIKNDIADINDNITIIKTDISFIKSSLKKKVDYDEFDELSRRVSLLEAKVKK